MCCLPVIPLLILLSIKYLRRSRTNNSVTIKTPSTKPIVSILIPVFSTEHSIESCLNSVLKQSFRDYEVIIIDDGSLDNSSVILQRYAAFDSRIRVFYVMNNIGLLMARKLAVQRARGVFCCFLDSDDYLASPTSLSTMVLAIQQEGTDIVHFPVSVRGGNSEFDRRWIQDYCKPFNIHLSSRDSILKQCFVHHKFGYTIWNKIYRMSICKQAFNMIPDTYLVLSEDLVGFFHIACLSNSYAGIFTEGLYVYQLGTGSSTKNRRSLRSFLNYITGDCHALGLIHSFIQTNYSENDFFTEIYRAIEDRALTDQIKRLMQLSDSNAAIGFDVLRQYHSSTTLYGKLFELYGSDDYSALFQKLPNTIGYCSANRNDSRILIYGSGPHEKFLLPLKTVGMKTISLPRTESLKDKHLEILLSLISSYQIQVVLYHGHIDKSILKDILAVKSHHIPFVLVRDHHDEDSQIQLEHKLKLRTWIDCCLTEAPSGNGRSEPCGRASWRTARKHLAKRMVMAIESLLTCQDCTPKVLPLTTERSTVIMDEFPDG